MPSQRKAEKARNLLKKEIIETIARQSAIETSIVSLMQKALDDGNPVVVVAYTKHKLLGLSHQECLLRASDAIRSWQG